MVRMKDGTAKLIVYRKKTHTHTDQYLNFTSHHLLHRKLGVIKTLLDRCNNIIPELEHREKEVEHIIPELEHREKEVEHIIPELEHREKEVEHIIKALERCGYSKVR